MSVKDLEEQVTDKAVSDAKLSLRLDNDEDDPLIRTLIKAARRDIIGQVGEQLDDFFDDNEIFTTAVLIEVGHLYNHRDSTSTQQEFEVPMALYSLINSLKDDYRYRISKISESKSSNEKAEESNSNAEPGIDPTNSFSNQSANSLTDK